MRLAVIALEIDSVGYEAKIGYVNDEYGGEPLCEWLGRRMQARTADGFPQRDLDDVALSA